MTQLSYGSLDREPDPSVSLVDQHQTVDAVQDALTQNQGFAPSRMVREDYAEPHTETNLGKRDLSQVHNHEPMKTDDVAAKHFNARVLDAPIPQCASPARIGRNGFLSSDPAHPTQSVPLGRQNEMDISGNRASNIIIFGETGVGKSSLINLIASEKLAHTSNGALGCTFHHERHVVKVYEKQCALWDTTGLDEGTAGRVPADLAEANLKGLIDNIAHSGGIHLVIYCIRASRLTAALKRNYDLFYVTVCRRKVPVALVVTGLEYELGDMETWWVENEAFLKRCGMRFDAYACVTTLDIDDPGIQERRLDSQRRLRDLVVKYARQRPWKIAPSLIPRLISVAGSLTSGQSFMPKRIVRRVVVYDRTASPGTQERSIGDPPLEYEWVCVDPLHPSVGPAHPSVLVFYASPSNDDISSEDYDALKTFYDNAGGESCPVIVVLRGCDKETIDKCQGAIHLRHEDIQVRCMADVRDEVYANIEDMCIEQVEVRSIAQLWRVFLQSIQSTFRDLTEVGFICCS